MLCNHTFAKMGLDTHIIRSSEKGLSSVTTLIVGSKAAAIIDPPFLIPDANAVVDCAKEKLSVPLKAVFVTHHRPDHYFSANLSLTHSLSSGCMQHPTVRQIHSPSRAIRNAHPPIKSAPASTASTMRR